MSKQQTVIFLVRHGETDRPYVADPQIDSTRRLTEHGRKQSRENGEYLAAFAPTAIYASPLDRTVETATHIAKAAGIPGSVKTGKDLYEIYDDASYHSIGTRVPRFFRQVIKEHRGQQVVCVSHMDVIHGVLRALGAKANECEFPCEMGEMYRLVFADDVFVQATKLRSKSK